MITTQRLVLTSGTPRILSSLEKFEGIQIAKNANEVNEAEIEQIWAWNKTPLIEGNGKRIGKRYSDRIVAVPSFGEENFVPTFTKWAYAHGFECGEFLGGKTYDSRKEPCIFCAIARHKGLAPSTQSYNAFVREEVDVIIYESQNFFVTVELGALKPGFIMVMPKAHFLSVAQFPDSIRDEYREVCEDCAQILKGAFGDLPVAFFEHGSGPSGKTAHKKSIVHAHTHVVHGFTMQQKYLDMVQARALDDIRKAKETHYFAYKTGASGRLFCCYDDNVYVPRQFARQIIALEAGYSEHMYNWRKFDFAENCHQTIYGIYKWLISGKLNNTRIQSRTRAFTNGYANRENFEHFEHFEH